MDRRVDDVDGLMAILDSAEDGNDFGLACDAAVRAACHEKQVGSRTRRDATNRVAIEERAIVNEIYGTSLSTLTTWSCEHALM